VNTFYRALAISLAASINRDVQVASRLNDGIAVLEAARTSRLEETPQMKGLTLALGSLASRLPGRQPYHKLVIHRYQLSGDFDGFSRWFDFDPGRIASLIERGIRDAVAHDCHANGCVGV
jgi:hypothetical protein